MFFSQKFKIQPQLVIETQPGFTYKLYAFIQVSVKLLDGSSLELNEF